MKDQDGSKVIFINSLLSINLLLMIYLSIQYYTLIICYELRGFKSREARSPQL